MTSEPKKHIVCFRQMPPAIVWGGLEKLMVQWFERIDHSRCRVTLIVSSGGEDIYRKHLKGVPVDIVGFPFRKDFRYTEPFMNRFKATRRLLQDLRPDQVIFFQGSYFDFDLSHVLAAHLAANGNVHMHENMAPPLPSPKTSKRYLNFIPGIGLWWFAERYSTRLRSHFSRSIISVGENLKNQLVSLWKYPASKIKVFYHGIDLNSFRPSADVYQKGRQDRGIPHTDIVICVSARLSQEKRIDRTIDAFDALCGEFPNLRLLIAGSGPVEEKLRSLAVAKTSRDRIVFLGHLENVTDCLKMSDIFVLSSDNEGFGLALVEAMACGLICVATKCAGPSEIIDEDRYGFLTEKSAKGVEEGLRKALKLNPEARNSLIDRARKSAVEKFEINANVRAVLDYLQIPRVNL